MRVCDSYNIVFLAHFIPSPYLTFYQMPLSTPPYLFKHLCHYFLLMPVGEQTGVSNVSTNILFHVVTHITFKKCSCALIESCSVLYLCVFIHFENDSQGCFYLFFRLHWMYIWAAKVIVQSLTFFMVSGITKNTSTLWCQIHDRFLTFSTCSLTTNFHSQNIRYIVWQKSPTLIIPFSIWIPL